MKNGEPISADANVSIQEFVNLVAGSLPIQIDVQRNRIPDLIETYILKQVWITVVPNSTHTILHMLLSDLNGHHERVVSQLSGTPDADWSWPIIPIRLFLPEGEQAVGVL